MSMGLDLLPTLNEGDERVSLGDILLSRDGCLTETELWAVCKECCLGLQGVHSSSDMFQTLCVTPDSVAFDCCGTVCFLDLAADPEPMYVPPEYESVGNSYKAHLYSLGMTLLFAAEYNVSMAVQRPFSADLGQTINKMTLDDFSERADLEFVIKMCNKNLGSFLSDEICMQLAATIKMDTSYEDEAFFGSEQSTRLHDQWDAATSQIVESSQSPESHNSSHSCSASPTHMSPVNIHDSDLSNSTLNRTASPASNTQSPISARKTPTKRASPFQSGIITPPDLFSANGTDGVSNMPDLYNANIEHELLLRNARDESEFESTPPKITKTDHHGVPDLLDSSGVMVNLASHATAGDSLNLVNAPMETDQRSTNADKTIEDQIGAICNLKQAQTQKETSVIRVIPGEASGLEEIKVTPNNDVRKEAEIAINADVNTDYHTLPNVFQHTPTATEDLMCSSDQDIQNNELARKPCGSPENGQNKSNSLDHNLGDKQAHSVHTSSNFTATASNNVTQSETVSKATDADDTVTSQLNENTKATGGVSEDNINTSNGSVCHSSTVNTITESTSATTDEVTQPEHIKTQAKLSASQLNAQAHTTPNIINPVFSRVTSLQGNSSQSKNLARAHETPSMVNHHAHTVDSLNPTAGSEQPTVTFNQVFGSRVHRDTSKDSLGLIKELDVLNQSSDQLDTSIESVSISSDLNSTPEETDKNENDTKAMKSGMDKLSGSTSLKRRVRERQKSQLKGQNVLEILERLGLGLHEAEVWALCRECVLAMQRNRLELPAYVSTETVVIEDTGRVTYRPVPDDKSLDLEFLAPELQQYGVVTEKSCLYGLAAMLWSTADFGLAPTHEPVLSSGLEHLLLTMTNENASERPTAIDVLQVCNEFQKKQETTSTKICQNLAAEARKAADFDKNNKYVKEHIEEDRAVQAKSIKAKVVHSIKTDTPQANLKPAADRPIAELVEEPTLHGSLMTEIRNPSKKRRKTSRPRVMTVQELYRNNPDCVIDLLRVTGKRRTPSPALPLTAFSPQQTSAFNRATSGSVASINSASGETERIESVASNASQGSVPDAYKSKATHFAPIVLNDSSEPIKTEAKPKIRSAKEEETVAQKIKQLKKNLMKNRLPINLAQDLENDVIQEQNQTDDKENENEQKAEQPQVAQLSPQDECNTAQTTVQHTPPAPNTLPVQHTPPAPNTLPVQHIPHTQQGQQMPPFFAQPNAMAPRTMPVTPTHIPYMQQEPHSLTGSIPNLAAPLSYPGMPQPFPYQIQLQQDPRTGLFQLIPVAVPNVALQPQPMTMTPQAPGHYVPMAQPNYDLLPPSCHHSNGSKSQPMSPYSGSSTDGEKPERVRHPRKKPSRDRRAAKPRQHSDSESSSSKSRSYEGQMLRRSRSEETDETTDNSGAGHHSNGVSSKSSDLSPVLEHRAPVPRASSVELLEHTSGNGPTQPRTPRTVKLRDLRNKLKRAKSGSSVDYRPQQSEIKSYEIYDDTYLYNKKLYASLSRSQPNLDADFLPFEVSRKSKSPSPPLSPSWSRDSGVSGVNVKASDMSLMERLLNGDTQRHQHRLTKVIKFIRDEFAFDGFMENGIEEMTMAEYIISLGNLTFETFSNAIREKYEDLYFEEDLVANLFDAVNGRRPVAERRSTPRNVEMEQHTATVLCVDEPHQPECVHLRSELKAPSAFRPISDPGSSLRIYPNQAHGESIVKPKALKYQKNQQKVSPRNSKTGLEKVKSSSLHDLLAEENSMKTSSSRIKSRSQEDLLEQLREFTVPQSRDSDLTNKVSCRTKTKATVIQVKSLDSSTDDTVSSSSRGAVESRQNKSQSNTDMNSQDSSASSTGEDYKFVLPNGRGAGHFKHPVTRQDSISSGSSNQSAEPRMTASRSESYLAMVAGDTALKLPITAQHYKEMSRMGRGCVVYYAAEMEHRLRQDVKNFAAQIDPKTKENIESKMAELDQQMMMEHRNKKKTQKYYRKLVDATKSAKVSNEHKLKLNTVSKQVEESTNKIDFLDAAKKHLEMLHAEQWGLDKHHLYALAKCQGDEPMLLGMCENPLLQYQLMRNPRLGIEGQFLQAGKADGLMAYLFAQYSLSEGFIHQFFYTFRYFTTSANLLRFICEKLIAACMSLQPQADIPTKVKARAVDLLQVWLEGYYTVDFKHNTQLLNECITFLQDKVVPVDSTAELLIEVIEEFQEGRKKDLFYPEFQSKDHDTNNNPTACEQPLKKWESFKAALHLNAKPMKLPKSDLKPRAGMKAMDEGTYQPKAGTMRAEAFVVLDQSTQTVAEQLTLIEQELFKQSHPVHYLNSKFLGISVALITPTIQRTQSLQRINSTQNAWEGVESDSLFMDDVYTDDIIQRMIEHAQNISFWVAAEIVSCSSQKMQVSLLTKFIYIAKCLQEMHNYATCVAIVDGLDNLIVRQLPAWKNLPTKCAAMKEELSSLKMFLKSDSLCLVGESGSQRVPTIPCILLFLIHVQQLEIGGFKLANQMYRWSKLKSIASMIDQIRVFRQHPYTFTANPTMQLSIQQRITEFCQHDLHTLASQHPTNVPKMSSGKLSLFKKKKKYKLDS